jgi:plasmid maintenance system killer protein
MRVAIGKRLSKVFRDAKAMQREYGPKTAKALQFRLAVLRAAPTLDHVPKGPPERCHQLTENRDEQFAVSIRDQWRLIFEVDQNPMPRKPDKGIDLTQVTAIVIVEVSDHYR